MSAGHRTYPLIFLLFLSIKALNIPLEVDEVAAINLLEDMAGIFIKKNMLQLGVRWRISFPLGIVKVRTSSSVLISCVIKYF